MTNTPSSSRYVSDTENLLV